MAESIIRYHWFPLFSSGWLSVLSEAVVLGFLHLDIRSILVVLWSIVVV